MRPLEHVADQTSKTTSAEMCETHKGKYEQWTGSKRSSSTNIPNKDKWVVNTS